nr:adenosine deaminase 2-like [Leptinotarsa decemlineata]
MVLFSNYLSVVAVAAVILCRMAENVVCVSDKYMEERHQILKMEKYMFIGGNTVLSEKEMQVNKIIMKDKLAELTLGYENITNFLPSQHFFKAKPKINSSKVFSTLKKIPKGASLHTHLLAGVSVDFIMDNFTYRENVYGCDLNGTFKLIVLRTADQDKRCQWKALAEYRRNDPNFDNWLRKQLSLVVENPHETYPTADIAWSHFKKIFTTEFDLISYSPFFREYIQQLLKELYLDNVMYTEIRGTFMSLYDLNGTKYDNEYFFNAFIETVEEFKRGHPDFLGVRYIHSIYRGVTIEVLKSGLEELIELKRKFPDFIVGFDFVGYEEEGKSLLDFHEILLEASKDLKFYFHAGETNWFGHTDLNLVDAVLLNTSRIGHGFGLDKHPVLIKIAKEKEMCVELCPISNQVLMLIQDPRNHPMVSLMAKGFPVVICNDDPSVWEATGLSYDWYYVFMAMTSRTAGIETLKQFALNSIKYSSMENNEKLNALKLWEKAWEKFLDEMIDASSHI